MKAIILAAGMGTRLKPITDTAPKCLTEIHGKSIIENALEHLEQVGVSETVIVIGYLGFKIKEKLGDTFGKMKLTYVENLRYSKTGTSYSLYLGLKDLVLDGNVLVLEGDVFFEKKILFRLISDVYTSSTAVQGYNPLLDGSFVEVRNEIVFDWLHKSARPPDFTLEDKYKTINIHNFGKGFVETILKPTLDQHVKDNGGTESIEFILQDVVKYRGGLIHAVDMENLKWFEVDTIEDLKIVERIFQ